MDLKKIVQESHMYIVKGTLNRVMFFEIDSILNGLIKMHISEPKDADKVLIITDKFYIYRQLWKGVLETLYEKYLPHIDYTFDWKIEITPYSIMLCELSKKQESTEEFERFLNQLTVNEEQVEESFDEISEKIGLEKLELNGYLEEILPEKLTPPTRKEYLSLLFRLMNFPPLEELAIFVGLYNLKIKNEYSDLSIGFSSVKSNSTDTIEMSESLHYSFYHFHHELLNNVGLNTIHKLPQLIAFRNEIEIVIAKAKADSVSFKDSVICPCCGEKQEVSLPDEILQYKLLLANKKVSKLIGFVYYDSFVEKFKKNLSDKFSSFLPNLNKVEHPECLILVEGESEEASIPLISFRKRFILSEHGIQVYNSKSKQKLKEDFFSFKEKYPERKMICILDSDAIKERDDLQRVINQNQDKYRLVFIENGTFEDLFRIEDSINTLNEMYPEGDLIDDSDFDSNKDFLSNVKKIMYFKKKADFDKVLFAKKISLTIEADNIPKELIRVIEIAKDLTETKNFIKN